MTSKKRKRIKCNEEYCVSCGLCSVACALAHDSDFENIIFLTKDYKLKSRNCIARRDALSFIVSCQNCKEPECLSACVSGAIIKDVDNTVKLDSEKCIGCCSCVMVCPFGAINIIEIDTGEKYSIKCDLCANREQPACIETCPNQALTLEEF